MLEDSQIANSKGIVLTIRIAMATNLSKHLWKGLKNMIKPMYCQLNLNNAQIMFGILQTDKRSLTRLNWTKI